jgi:MOSC domain-containing protein YiiM
VKVLAVNVGRPRGVAWKDGVVTTGIFKSPVDGAVRVDRSGLEGDGQADLSVHGGEFKAVYAYPVEHYAYWRERQPGMDEGYGVFGENLTVEGLLEDDVRIGDRFRIGSAELQATDPRFPCHKLGIRFGDESMVKRFLESGRSGIYFSVAVGGELRAGDAIERVARGPTELTIADVVRLKSSDPDNVALLSLAVENPALPPRRREAFRERLRRLESGAGD